MHLYTKLINRARVDAYEYIETEKRQRNQERDRGKWEERECESLRKYFTVKLGHSALKPPGCYEWNTSRRKRARLMPFILPSLLIALSIFRLPLLVQLFC